MPAAIDTRLTPSEAARCAGVSVDTVRGWVRAGVLQAERMPLGSLISSEALGALIAAREQQTRERAAGRPRHIPRAAEGGSA